MEEAQQEGSAISPIISARVARHAVDDAVHPGSSINPYPINVVDLKHLNRDGFRMHMLCRRRTVRSEGTPLIVRGTAFGIANCSISTLAVCLMQPHAFPLRRECTDRYTGLTGSTQ